MLNVDDYEPTPPPQVTSKNIKEFPLCVQSILINAHPQMHTHSHMQHSLTHIQHQIFNSCLEYPLPNCYTDTTVFNDLAIHIFPLSSLTSLPKDTWTDTPQPSIDPLDPEIITT